MQAKKVQAIVRKYGKLNRGDESGHSNEWIYTHKVEPVFDISRVTFYDYLRIDVRFELKQLNIKE